ncbi:MAG: MotA/TolQ/ExbB proton channel family protein [Candidatus Thiodiazotropha endolucinida]
MKSAVNKFLRWMLKLTANCFNHYHFALNLAASAVLVVASYLGGTLIYEKIMADKQTQLLETYKQVDVLCDILSENPKFAQGLCNENVPSTDLDDADKRKIASDSPYNIEVLRYFFEKAGLYDPDDVDESKQLVDAKEMPGTAYLTQIFMGEDPADSPFLKMGDANAKSLDLIKHIAVSLGDEGCVLEGGKNLTNILAIGMSQIQYQGTSPFEAIQAPCESEEHTVDGAVYRPNKQAISDNDLLSYIWTVVHANNAEVVYSDNNDVNQWGNPSSKVTEIKKIEIGDSGELVYGKGVYNPEPEDIDKIYDTARMFSQFLMGKIHSNDLVAEKRKELVMFRGFEQQIMLCLLIFVLLIIFMRFVYRKLLESLLKELDDRVLKINSPEPQGEVTVEETVEFDNTKTMESYRLDGLQIIKSTLVDYEIDGLTKNIVFKTVVMIKNKLFHPLEDDVDKMRNALTLDTERIYNSRWIVRWTAITIPAIGFVGTVRGILQSLSQADIIVWASNQSERAAAIGEISGELGLAFATTLIALIIGIAISVFNEHQSKNESNFVFHLEEIGSKFLDYRYRGIDGEVTNAKG